MAREPLRVTLTRTVGIALIAGAALASRWGGLARWPLTTVLMLWPSLGGHYVELAYLDVVRPRLSPSRAVRTLARIAVWFVGGALLAVGMRAHGDRAARAEAIAGVSVVDRWHRVHRDRARGASRAARARAVELL